MFDVPECRTRTAAGRGICVCALREPLRSPVKEGLAKTGAVTEVEQFRQLDPLDVQHGGQPLFAQPAPGLGGDDVDPQERIPRIPRSQLCQCLRRRGARGGHGARPGQIFLRAPRQPFEHRMAPRPAEPVPGIVVVRLHPVHDAVPEAPRRVGDALGEGMGFVQASVAQIQAAEQGLPGRSGVFVRLQVLAEPIQLPLEIGVDDPLRNQSRPDSALQHRYGGIRPTRIHPVTFPENRPFFISSLQQRRLKNRPFLGQSDETFAKVSKVIEEVRKFGDRAILAATKEFDRVDLVHIEVSDAEFEHAWNSLEPDIIESLKEAIQNHYEPEFRK